MPLDMHSAHRTAIRLRLTCLDCPIRNRSLCAALSDDEIAAPNRISQRRHLRAGEVFAIEGEDMLAFADIVGGIAKLTRALDDGREQIVGLCFRPIFLNGRPARRGRRIRTWSRPPPTWSFASFLPPPSRA